MDLKIKNRDPFDNLWLLPLLLLDLLTQTILKVLLLLAYLVVHTVYIIVKIYRRPVSWVWLVILLVIWYFTSSFSLAVIISTPLGFVLLWRVLKEINVKDEGKQREFVADLVKQYTAWRSSRK